MVKSWIPTITAAAALVGGFYGLQLKGVLQRHGVIGRIIESVNNERCHKVPELQACEKIFLHQPSGLLYAACSSPLKRKFWTPGLGHLDATARLEHEEDYIATYDPLTSTVSRLNLAGFEDPRGLFVHGFDIAPSSTYSNELFVYVINHRPPIDEDPTRVGSDSVMEIFRTMAGDGTLKHVTTVRDPVIETPNDVLGLPDGKSFYFTNDHGRKVGLSRYLEFFGGAWSSVGYCHVDSGCHYALRDLPGSNGIVQAHNGTIYVTSTTRAEFRALRSQPDNTLQVIDIVSTDRILDNIAVDENGDLWIAGIVDTLAIMKTAMNPDVQDAPSSALRVIVKEHNGSMTEESYQVARMFEDDGTLVPGTTSVIFDSRRSLLYMHGLSSPHLSVCRL